MDVAEKNYSWQPQDRFRGLKVDFKSAFQRCHLDPSSALQSCTQLSLNEDDKLLIMFLRLTFGSKACPSKWRWFQHGLTSWQALGSNDTSVTIMTFTVRSQDSSSSQGSYCRHPNQSQRDVRSILGRHHRSHSGHARFQQSCHLILVLLSLNTSPTYRSLYRVLVKYRLTTYR